MLDPIVELVQERKNTHGNYELQSTIYYMLKTAVNYASKERSANPFKYTQQQSIDMICLKLSRILAGDAAFKDHWDDIAGYAKIANGMLPPLEEK
jgi:hypothetical protein